MRGSRCIYGNDMDHPLQTLQSAGGYARIAWRGVSLGLRGELAAEGAVAGVASVQSVGVHSAGVDCWLRAGRAEVGEDDIEVVDIDEAVVVSDIAEVADTDGGAEDGEYCVEVVDIDRTRVVDIAEA